MKQIKIIVLIIFGLFFFSNNGISQNNQLKNRIEVIDFYSTHRCMTCNAIESNTKYTLDTYFSDELKSGKISFLTINVDEKENYEMAEKFEAAGTALFLNVIINGKEHPINITDFAFFKGREKDKFSKELKLKIEKELNRL